MNARTDDTLPADFSDALKRAVEFTRHYGGKPAKLKDYFKNARTFDKAAFEAAYNESVAAVFQQQVRDNTAKWVAAEVLRAIPFNPRFLDTLEWERRRLRRNLAAGKPKKKRAPRKKKLDPTN